MYLLVEKDYFDTLNNPSQVTGLLLLGENFDIIDQNPPVYVVDRVIDNKQVDKESMVLMLNMGDMTKSVIVTHTLPATSDLHGCVFFGVGYSATGRVYNDTLRRFEDGTVIRTSGVVWNKHGYMKTRNSLYHLIDKPPVIQPADGMDSHTLAHLLLRYPRLPIFTKSGNDPVNDNQELIDWVCGVDFGMAPGKVVITTICKEGLWYDWGNGSDAQENTIS